MMKKILLWKKDFLAILFITFLTFFAIAPLFKPGFFPIHDNEQVGRLYDLDQTLRAGNFPPRIAPNLGFGYGYPFFNFYPYFVYALAEVFVFLGFSYIVSIKIMIALGFIAAGLAMYVLSREFFGRIGAVVSAIVYIYLPYHSVDVYVRGALPEFWAFVFLPLIFWAIYKLYKTNRNTYIILTAICIALLILTHNLVAFMSAPFIGIFVLLLLTKSAKPRILFLKLFICGLLGLTLSAFFWLPSYAEKQFTMIDLLTTELADYNQHFLYIRQFWNSPWGYGGSIYGLLDGLSFQAGKIQIILSAVAFFYALYAWKKKSKDTSYILLFFGFFLFSLFMCTFYSQSIWRLIPPLWYVQFPWRFLLLAGFASAFLSAVPLQAFKKTDKKIFTSIVLIAGIILFNKDFFVPERYLEYVTDKDYTNTETIRYETSSLAAEYVPKGIATRKTDINTTVVDIDRASIASSSYEIVRGDMHVRENKNIPQKKEFLVEAKTDGIIQINTFSFPGWKVFIDGNESTYTDNNRLKLITVSISPGRHKLEAILTDTPVRSIGNTLSLISFFGIIGYVFFFSARLLYNK